MLKMLAIALSSYALVSLNMNAQDGEMIAKLENNRLLSKTGESFPYSQIRKKYQIVIFTRIEDCSTCISKDSPWIQMIRSKNIPACFVFMSRSFRVAKYYYEANSLPFDFYCDTALTTIQRVGSKNTPVVLVFNEKGSQIFFDNPLYAMKRFFAVINSVDSRGGRNE